MKFQIDVNGFLETLPIMLYGMVGIFVVIGIIYVIIAGLNKAFSK